MILLGQFRLAFPPRNKPIGQSEPVQTQIQFQRPFDSRNGLINGISTCKGLEKQNSKDNKQKNQQEHVKLP
jgi:hypothetical protein